MGTVHRNGTPPKHMPHKRIKEFERGVFDEEFIVHWCREHLKGPMQYRVVEFQPERIGIGRSYEVTAWFKNHDDAEAFENQWQI